MPTTESIIVRFTFLPERAAEFIEAVEDERIGTYQPTVSEFEVDDVHEIMDCVMEFDDALIDCNAIIDGKVVNLSDFRETT